MPDELSRTTLSSRTESASSTASSLAPSIGSRLAILVIGVVLLMISATVPIVDRYRRAEQAQTLDTLQVTARVLGQAVIGEFDREQTALAALASSPALAKDDFDGFHAEADAFLARVSGQTGTSQQFVVVYGPSGNIFATTGVPVAKGEQPSNPNAVKFVRQAIQSKAPVFSDLFTSRTLKPVVTTNVPIIRDGDVPFVLAISSMPERYRFIIAAQGMPEGWISTVFDRNGVTIARNAKFQETVGTPEPAGLVAAARTADQGIVDFSDRDGERVRAAFVRLPQSGWTVAAGIPVSELRGPLIGSAWFAAAVVAVVSSLAVAFAFWYNRRIAGPIATLADMAAALGRGEARLLAHLDLREAQLVADQIETAAATLNRHRAQEDELLASLERRVAERTRELAAEEARYRQLAGYSRNLIEASLDPLVTISAEGKITDLNEATAKATGLGREQMVGTDFADYFTEPEKARAGYRQAFEKGFVLDYPLSLRGRSGAITDVLYNASLYRDATGAVAGVFAAARDVTERKRAEAEVRRLNEDLERRVAERTAQLEAANKELESFSYSVSHDLRTPLRAIDGFSRILLEDYNDKLDAEGQRILGVVRQGTEKMARLIDDILAFSRAGRLQLTPTEIDMNALVADTLQELEPAKVGREIAFQIGTLPPMQGDLAMIRRVWMNYLDNAIKFTRPKADARIEIGAMPGDNETIYFIKDNGVGFDMQYAPKLFGVFQRLHGGDEFPGTGIGLAIVKRIVERHGGRVWAEGKLGEGASFYFAIPVKE